MLGPRGMPKSACEFRTHPVWMFYFSDGGILVWDGQFADQIEHRTLVGIRDPRVHARIRRLWARGFTPEAVQSYQSILDKRVGQLVELLTARAGQTVDIAKWISWFAYDVMNDMAFGDEVEMMQTQDGLGLWQVMEDSHPSGLFLGHLPWLASLAQEIPTIAGKVNAFREHSRLRVLRRLRAGPTHKDLFYHLMDESRIDSTPPAFEQVVSDAPLVIAAGADTVSTVITNVFYFLVCNPIAYARVQNEIDASRLSSEDVNGLAKLQYLNAAINETLRLIPAVLSGTSRSPLMGSGGFMLGPHYIPEGTSTGIHTYTMQRDPRYFFMSERYLPERWLPAERQIELEPEIFKHRERVIHNVNAFLPFSYGPADCVGKRFAMQELRAVTCAVLQHFTLQFAKGYDKASWESDLCDFFVLKKPTLPIVFTPR
ncbi:hypothetical protein C0991_005825 [Blastosporella zonata]|nr:hypothetical protein C0991_005825 [Blastosporella zonata]